MATYGLDLYDKALYGAPILINYAVRGLAATSTDFGRIRISWTAPVQNVWTSLVLVRSRYGYPVSVGNGDVLATFSSTQASTSYEDGGLTPGYWYYSIFAAVPLPAWSATLTYQPGDRVSYSAQNWIAVSIAPAGTTPSAGVYWAVSQETAIYQPAGAVAGMAVADHGYAALIDSYIPPAYKTAPVLTTDDEVPNGDLADFLEFLAWGFEIVGTENDDLYHLYDLSTTRFDRLLEISVMLGITGETASSPRYQRLRTAQAAALGREKGTAHGLVDLIEAATGLRASVATGPNLMLRRDQSDFPYPLYPAWHSDQSYTVGDLVTYQGARYQCVSWALAPTFTGSPNTATTGSVPVAYTAENSATQPASLTATFTAPVTGIYTMTVTFMNGPANGMISTKLDGSGVSLYAASGLHVHANGWSVDSGTLVLAAADTYAASEAVGSTYAVPLQIPAGTHTLSFLASIKNASSTGYDVQVQSCLITAAFPQYPPSASPPTNAAANTGSEWAAAGAAAAPGYANPQTGQVSSWSLTGTSAALAVTYLGHAGLSMDTNWLSPTNGPFTLSSVYTMISAAYPAIAAYNGATAYVPGQIVTGPVDGLQYSALVATTGNAPPDPGVWGRTGYAAVYDRELIARSATPIHPAAPYDPQASYAQGAVVSYGQALFTAPAPVKGVTPPGSAGASNSGWVYLGPAAAPAWTASLYNPVPTTGTTAVYSGLEYFDGNGQPITSASIMGQSGTLISTLPIYARMIEPLPELNATMVDTGTLTFTASPTGYWQISSGAANANASYAGSQSIKFLSLSSGLSDCNVGLTFPAGVTNSTIRDVGILFRYSDATHFLAAMRDKIVSYNGGVKTTLASYTRLAFGTRMFLQLTGSTIKLYTYPGNSAAPSLVTTVTSTFNQSASVHGVVDWTW